MRTSDAIEAFLYTRRARRVSDHTLARYTYSLGKLEALYPDLPTSPSAITDLLIANEHLSDASIQGIWRSLKSFFGWVEIEGIGRDVMAGMPAPIVRKRLRKILTQDECARLLESCYTERDFAIIALFMDTGMRVGEMVGMRHEHLLMDGVRVTGKTGERLIPVTPNLMSLVRSQGGGSQAVWVGEKGALTISGIQRIVREAMKRAGIKPPRLGPHALRHTFAVQYITSGADFMSLQKILGHRKLTTTMIYAELTTDLLLQQHRKFSPMKHFSQSQMQLASADVAFVEAGRRGGRNSGIARRKTMSKRDRRIMKLLDAGMAPTEVARRLKIDRKTVYRCERRNAR